MALKAGTVLADRFKIIQEHARGGMSIVYLAMDMRLNSTKAVKEIRRVEDASNRMGMIHYKALLTEANLLKKLDHAYLPRIFDVIETDDYFYIVMDFLEGITLSRYLETTKAKRASQADTIKWGLQVARVLQYLHYLDPPIIYRDMKPGNVMLQPDGNIKLFDFGISRSIESGASGATTALGSKGYAAPEQGGDMQRFDQRSDIYALGRTMYHLVTGHNPKVSPELIKPIRDWDPALSSGLESIILKCTEEDPNNRYQSVDDLIYAMENYQDLDLEVVKKSKIKLSIIGVCMVAGIFSLSGSFIAQQQHNRQETNKFDTFLTQGLMSRSADDLIQALTIDGTDLAIYHQLLDIFGDDGVFDTEEERQLNILLAANRHILEQDPGFPDFAYELGRLYWFHFEGGQLAQDTLNIQGRINAIQWFDEAAVSTDPQVSMMAINFATLGDFYRNIVTMVERAEDSGMYASAFESMVYVVTTVEDMPELVRLENVRMAYTFLDLYTAQLYRDGVTYEEVMYLFDQSTELLLSTIATAERTILLREELESQTDAVSQALTSVWKQGERGGTE